ncbi:MAG: 3-phosphoglycerate dehydrogenase [Clostridia bacterium]|nr:3-phosphoglycerate dehydrogenase [Clostridia bacterium]
MFDILTLNKIAKCGTDRFDAKYACSDNAENPAAVMVRSASMHETEFGSNLLAIARAGAGVNNIPIDRCSDAGIAVFNTPGANANAVKELVICAALLASRKITDAVDWCKTLKGEGANVSKLVEKGKSAFAGPEIKGKTMGVVGLGAIGALVANAAISMGMDVIGYDPFLSVNGALSLNPAVKVTDDIANVYAAADYITLHLPFNDKTKDTVSAQTIATMKDGVRILNFARGELVNSDDIIAALESGKVAAYVTDFPTDAQIGVEGVVAIPHLGASTPESEDNCAVMAADELIAYLERGEIKNSVNLPNVALPAAFETRVCVIFKETDGIQSEIIAALGNTASLVCATKKGMGYLAADISGQPDVDKLNAIDGVVRVRVI